MNDLCLEISQTSSCTSLKLTHLLCDDDSHPQPDVQSTSLFFLLFSLPVMFGVLWCVQNLNLVKKKQRVYHMKVEFPVKLFFLKSKSHCIPILMLREEFHSPFMFRSISQRACVSFSLSLQIVRSVSSLNILCLCASVF